MRLIGQLNELKDVLLDKYEENQSEDVKKDYIAVCEAIEVIENKNRIIARVIGICVVIEIILRIL